jgi:lysophospholipase L1-like esterase
MSTKITIVAALLFVSVFQLSAQSKRWVGTWATAEQLVETSNMPPLTLTDNTIRQIVRVSIGGDTMRLKLSNEFSTSAIVIKEVQIAASKGNGSIDVSTSKTLKFNGLSTITMNTGTMIVSDPIAFALTPRMDVAITIYYGTTSTTVTGHPGSRTTSYILAGNALSSADMAGNTPTDHWYNISGIDVLAPKTSACVGILGNSITDGRGSTTNLQNRWTDIFSESLLQHSETSNIGVLNFGIGGNCVLSGGLGPTANSRYDRDIISQSGLKYVLVFIGVNDIGGVTTAAAATSKASDLINAFKSYITRAHAINVRIYGATILPFNGSSYYNEYSDLCRNTVNQWIRTGGFYDGVIDFDRAIRSTADTTRLVITYQNDGLHPDAATYVKMGQYIPIGLFAKADTVYPVIVKTGIETYWFEAERFVSATAGSNFDVVTNALASNSKYITAKAGLQSLAAASTNTADLLTIPFTVTKDSTYQIYARLNCPTYDDDSYWVKMDNGSFTMVNGLSTGGSYSWMKLLSPVLTKGNHTLTICYREDGACMDKLCITNENVTPTGMGSADPIMTTTFNIKDNDGFSLQWLNSTLLCFEIPTNSRVTFQIHSILGSKIKDLTSSEFKAGRHTIPFDTNQLSKGIYICTMTVGTHTLSTKMYVTGK